MLIQSFVKCFSVHIVVDCLAMQMADVLAGSFSDGHCWHSAVMLVVGPCPWPGLKALEIVLGLIIRPRPVLYFGLGFTL